MTFQRILISRVSEYALDAFGINLDYSTDKLIFNIEVGMLMKDKFKIKTQITS